MEELVCLYLMHITAIICAVLIIGVPLSIIYILFKKAREKIAVNTLYKLLNKNDDK